MSSPSVIVQVPGTTSNLGPGFDTLGVALNVHNRVWVSRNSSGDPKITSPISDEARPGAIEVVKEAAHHFFQRTRRSRFGFDIHLSGDVPIARGLGSSVTVRLGTLAALNQLTRAGLTAQDLFESVSQLEGHADNAAPATFGGFTAAGIIDGRARCVRLPVVRRLRFVALIPRFEISTEAARRLVPRRFSREDAVHNLVRVSQITAAMARGDVRALKGLFEDRLHQPYRRQLIPQLDQVIRAGERAGAVGGWLSGSGSTIICVTAENADKVGRAMRAQLAASDIRVLRADARGYRITRGPVSD